MTSQHDDLEHQALTSAVAITVARVRTNLGIDIETLARWSGLSAALLRCIEEGSAAPTLRELWALARVFEVPFGILLGGSRLDDAEFQVLRASQARVVESAGGGFRSRALLVTEDPHEPEVYEITLRPGCVEEAAPHAHATFEHVVVLRGTLLVRAGASEATLHSGDALFFRADRPHAYENPGSDATIAHLTMTYAGDSVQEVDGGR